MYNELTPQRHQHTDNCEKCRKALDTTSVTWLELSNTDDQYYDEIPAGHVSQGCFPFCHACAKEVLTEQILAACSTPRNQTDSRIVIKVVGDCPNINIERLLEFLNSKNNGCIEHGKCSIVCVNSQTLES